MSISIYTVYQLTAAAIALFISIMLIVKRMPSELEGSAYEKSRRLMGYSLLILPVLTIFFHCTPLINVHKHYATALCLCGYYPTATLAHIALLSLIGQKINLSSTRFRVVVATFFIFPVLVIFGIAHFDINKTLIIANTLLFASIVADFIYFYAKYSETNLHSNNIKLTEIKLHLRWVRKSIYMIAALAVISCFAPMFIPYNKWLNSFCILYTLVIFVYVYESYNRFIIRYHVHNIKAEKRTITMNPELYATIQKKTNAWLAKKKYHKTGVTIELAASDMCTNRTYLSTYINSTYGCSFKVWITTLRMNEAKKLLLDEHNYTVNYIAQKIGFSSQTSFIHVFRNTTGLPPAKWREQNKIALDLPSTQEE